MKHNEKNTLTENPPTAGSPMSTSILSRNDAEATTTQPLDRRQQVQDQAAASLHVNDANSGCRRFHDPTSGSQQVLNPASNHQVNLQQRSTSDIPNASGSAGGSRCKETFLDKEIATVKQKLITFEFQLQHQVLFLIF